MGRDYLFWTVLGSHLAQESRSLSFVAKTLEPYTLGSSP